ncbi:HdeA/HdeB family chaperone [Methylocystis sp. ATCC 49242]|uniref:HdeA/HdeB family chaperone n=1 Tax=Methylocystis sp. ATCC 49242 TaxID=622637 RepID=UPI0001F86D28|nr:HdeA/HdeB family chaperone [Methylocystis sp. ATCC 49242]
MKLKLAYAAIVALAMTAPASAQVMIEMSEITCKQFSEYDPETKAFIGSWMSGYFSATKNLSVVDSRYVKRNYDKIHAYCKKHSKESLMSAIEKNAR